MAVVSDVFFTSNNKAVRSMVYYLLIVTIIVKSIISVTSTTSSIMSCSFPAEQYTSLELLYNNTQGSQWLWQRDYAADGVPWNFTVPVNNITNPCTTHWQYLTCNSNCEVMNLHLNNVSLNGTLPNSVFEGLSSLVNLTIANNPLLYGTIPTSLLTSSSLNQTLSYIDLSNNALGGTLPGDFAEALMSLTYLDLSKNYRLSGSLPQSLATHLFNIELMDFSSNRFTDCSSSFMLSTTISFASSLRTWDISHNQCEGSIPSSLYNTLQRLVHIDFSNNFFSQNLPSFNNDNGLSRIQYFDVRNNLLSNTLPNDYPVSLRYLDLSNNLFIGNLPVEPLSIVKSLIFFNVSYNLLDGSIENSMFNTWSLLSVFEISHNHFTGVLPRDVFNVSLLPRLSYFGSECNFFSSQLPDSGDSANSALVTLTLNNNLFSGVIPSSFSLLSQLELLNINSNLLEGSLPSSLGEGLIALIALNVSENSLDGSIPSSFSSLVSMEYLDLSYNFFTGTISSSMIQSMNNLVALLIQNNQFSGKFLVDIPDQSLMVTNPLLSLVDVGNNRFTGGLSTEVFSLPSLTTLVMISNCFDDASIPSNICDTSKLLHTLVLDGLHAAEACTETYFPSTNTYPLAHPVEGTIPACLFTDFPNLQTLHMSGNGIEGSLPKVASISPSLIYLTLSHNQLTGSIENAYQQHVWQELDLSFNKLTGGLSDSLFRFAAMETSTTEARETNNAYSTSVLHLELNRLSGNIPSSLRHLENINILQGNIFACDDDKSTLPLQDPHYYSYDCGSNNFASSVYTWLGCYGAIVLIVIVCILRRKLWFSISWIQRLDRMEQVLLSYWDIYRGNSISLFIDLSVEHLVEWGLVFKEIRVWCMRLTFCIVVLFIPLYLILDEYYSTYTQTYALSLSLSFLSGIPPAVILSFMLACGLMCLYSRFFSKLSINLFFVFENTSKEAEKLHKLTHSSLAKRPISTRISLAKENLILYGKILGVLLLNLIVVMPATVGFIYSNDAKMSITEQQSVVIAFTLFKIMWNFVIYELMRLVFCRTSGSKGQRFVSFVSLSDEMYSFFAIFMTWISLFNHIIAPCIAAMIFSPSCFFYTISRDSRVTADYSTESCSIAFIKQSSSSYLFYPTVICGDNNDIEGIQQETFHSVHYNPPFFYSYHCSSEILKDFDEVFVLRFLINGLILPLTKVAAKVAQEYIHHLWVKDNLSMNERQTTTISDSRMTDAGTGGIRPSDNVDPNSHTQSFAVRGVRSTVLANSVAMVKQLQPQHWMIGYLNMLIPPVLQIYNDPPSTPQEIEVFEKSMPKQIFGAENFLIDIVTDIALVLTFGVMFPPLAVIGCISVLSLSCFKQLIIGRAVSLARIHPYLTEFVEKLNSECVGARAIVTRALSSFMELLALFWAGYMFDILGDAVGYKKAISLLVLMSCVPIFIRTTNFLHDTCCIGRSTKPDEKVGSDSSRSSDVQNSRTIELPETSLENKQDDIDSNQIVNPLQN